MRSTCSRVLATLFVATLALGVTVALAADIAGSPSSPATPRVAFVTGEFEMANSSDGQAIVTADDVAPGSSASGQVTITNAGEITGPITLSKADVVDEPGPAGAALSEIADVTVNDVTGPGAPITVYAGRVGAMPDVALGTFEPGEARTYGFVVSLPDGAAGADDINAYQAASLRFGYVWTGTGAEAPGAPPPPAQGGTPAPSDSPPPPDRAPTDAPPVADKTPADSASGRGDDDGRRSPTDASSNPGGGSSQPSPQAPAIAGPSSGASRAPDRSGRGDRTNSAKRRNGGHRDRTPPGSTTKDRDSSAAKDRHKRSGLAAVFDALKRALTAAAEKGSFPLLLLLLLAAFFYLQHWLDRRDPKLALAPVDAEPTRTFD